MRSEAGGDTRSREALKALLRIREIEDQEVRSRLHEAQAAIAQLEGEIAALKRRRDGVIRRGGGQVLRERRLLDEIMRVTLRKARELETLRLEAFRLVEEHLEARNRKDAVRSLRDRRRAEVETERERRRDQAACDVAAARKARGRREEREAPWED